MSSVRSVYDLAGVITALYSRNYLDPSTTINLGAHGKEEHVQFADIYETAIGHISEKETQYFEEFTKLPTDDVAEIKGEIESLYKIKDVLDELNIMSVLFHDQRRVFKDLQNILQSTHADQYRNMDLQISTFKPSSDLDQDDSEEEAAEFAKGDTSNKEDHSIGQFPDNIQKDKKRTGRVDMNTPQKRNKVKIMSPWDEVFTATLPMDVVNFSIEDVKGMIGRANQARKALNFLVDLKFKHNNVIDSKKSLNMSQTTKDLTTKISESGEKSVSLSNETKALTSEIKRSTEATCEAVDKTADLATKADRDGRTVMVFTVVTIIFLPLSFMATMFQLPIDQYKRTDDKLDLGYVSAIMFPISALISMVLIWVAFKADKVEDLFKRGFKGKKKVPANETSSEPKTSHSPSLIEPQRGSDMV